MAVSQFDLISAKVKVRQDEINRRALIAVSRFVILKTPVDTGIARTGWQFGVGNKPGGEADGDPINALIAAVQPMKVGELGYFINVVPYIIPLEYGHSKQAPAGMLRITIARWNSIVAKASREVK